MLIQQFMSRTTGFLSRTFLQTASLSNVHETVLAIMVCSGYAHGLQGHLSLRKTWAGTRIQGFFIAPSRTRNNTLVKPSHSRVVCLSGWGVTAWALGLRTPITAPANSHMKPNCS